MNHRIYLLGLLGVSACSGGVASIGARAEMPAAPVARSRTPAPVATQPAAAAPLAYHDESDSVRVSLQNAERAIREYTEFIARAGDREEYAPAVKRSREQIRDLQDTLVFVRAGAAEKP